MDKKLLKICKYLDYDLFCKASEKQLKQSLQILSDYLAQSQCRKRVALKFLPEIKDNDCVATAYLDGIKLYIKDITDYEHYLQLFDSVIHESFHIFEYYFLNLPKALCDDIMWQRVLSYNFYFIAGDQGISYNLYRFNDFELDAYRHTDLFLKTIYNKLKSLGKNVEGLKKYILLERKIFSKDVSLFKKRYGKFAKQIIDDFYIETSVKTIKENNGIDATFKEIISQINNGEYIYSICNNNEIVDLSQEFIDNAQSNFKAMLPHLYGTSKHLLFNNNFPIEL